MDSEIVPGSKDEEKNEAEKNLKTLAESNILADFVKEHKGEWDHQAWLWMYQILEDANLIPIDFDKVGLLLEEKRADFLQDESERT